MADESDKIVTEAEPTAPQAVEVATEAAPAAEIVPEILQEAPTPATVAEPAPEPVPAPAKARAPRKARQPAPSVPAPQVEAIAAEPTKLRKAPARAAKPVAKAAVRPKAATPKVAVRKAAPTKAPVRPAPNRKTIAVTQNKNTGPGKPAPSQLKETIMAKTFPTDFTATFQNVFSEMQDKAKSAYEKSTAALGEVNDFTKGNVEALVESGKILASGLQELGSTVVADSRSAFETMTSDVKELAAVKSPTDFFQIQSALLRRNFDSAVALGSKSTEAWLKLVNEAASPISSRVSLAVEKVSKAA